MRSAFSRFIIIFGLAALILPSPASAILTKDENAVINGTPNYIADDNDCSTNTASGTLSGNDNVEKAYNFFFQHGLTAEQTSGMIGNLLVESGLDPTKNQLNGGAGRGIAQWGVDGRWVLLLRFADERKAKGETPNDPLSLGLQLDFIWKELTSTYSGVLAAVKASTTIDEAETIIEKRYEIPGIPHHEQRIQFAHETFAKFGGAAAPNPGDPSLPPVTAPASSNCDTNVGAGQNTRFLDGFTIYSQTDPAWGGQRYGGGTIGSSGCGPSAMAMVITNLIGTRVTPDVTAKYAESQGLAVAAGSSWNISPVLAKNWGLKATPVGIDIAKINSTLQSGGLVITSGQGPLPFTSGGHFIVIRALTSGGKWKIGDSGHRNTNDQEWDPQELIVTMSRRNGSAYAITK